MEDKRVVPMIHVPDVRATVDWYRDIGFAVTETFDDGGDGLSFAILSFGSSEVMFNSGGQPSKRDRREVDLYVYSDNVDHLYQRLKNRVEVVEGPHDTFYGMRELIIRDLNRFWVTFGQYAPPGPPEDFELRLQTQGNRLRRLLPPETNIACEQAASRILEGLQTRLASPDWEENLLREIRRELANHQRDLPDVQDTEPTGPIVAAALSTAAAVIALISKLMDKADDDRDEPRVKELEEMKEKLTRVVALPISWVERQPDEVFVCGPL